MIPRLSLWYGLTVGALGMMPFLAPTLEAAGHTEAQVAGILLMIPVAALFGGPIAAWFSDRSGDHHRVIRAALLGTAACVGAMLVAPPAILALCVVLLAWVRTPIFPLADAATLHAVGDGYGRVRAVGSVAYVAMVLAAGLLRDVYPLAPLVLGAGLLVCAAAVTDALPPIPKQRSNPELATLAAHLFRGPTALVLVVALLNGMSISIYDHLFTLYMDSRGVPASITSFGVGWGVLVEVGVLLAGSSLLERFGVRGLLVIATFSAVPRFLGTAWLDDPWAIAALQGLHGLHFGAFWIAGLAWMSRTAPPDLRRSSQAAFAAIGFGLASILALGTASLWLGYADLRLLFGLLVLPAGLATVAALALPRIPPAGFQPPP